MSKKILIFPVGGTICTAADEEGVLSVNAAAPTVLEQHFLAGDSVCADDVSFCRHPNFELLSENITVQHWNTLVRALRSAIDAERPDGVIVLHGTDSLAYTAALFSLLFCQEGMPVIFVSANAPMYAENSNAHANFRAAVECICAGLCPNVYAVYRNPSDGRTYLHLASRLQQIGHYSEDVTSAGQTDLTGLGFAALGETLQRVAECFPTQKVTAIRFEGEKPLQPCVLCLQAHIGLDYTAFDLKNYKAVLHYTYHSGTVCVQPQTDDAASVTCLLERCGKTGTDVYLSPCRLQGQVYRSLDTAAKHRVNGRGIIPLYGCTDEMTYIKLLLAYSCFAEREQIDALLQREWNFERINRV